MRTLAQLALEIAKQALVIKDEWVREALNNLQPTDAIKHITQDLPGCLVKGRALLLAGDCGVGKTVAMYYGFAIERAVAIKQVLESKRKDYEHYITNVRPGTLAMGEPIRPEAPVEQDETSQRKYGIMMHMYGVHLSAYENALRGKPEPNYSELEDALLYETTDGYKQYYRLSAKVHRAQHLLDRYWDDKRSIYDVSREHGLIGLDDFNEGQCASEWHRNAWDEFISNRHSARQPLIICTNLSVEGILKSYGPRIADRLRQWAEVWDIKGKSMRRAQ